MDMNNDLIEKCQKCYHLIKLSNGSYFCFTYGCITKNHPPLENCFNYIETTLTIKEI